MYNKTQPSKRKTLGLMLLLALFFSVYSFGQINPNSHYVRGYYRSNGTYVKGHYRTNRNYTNRDNYSTKPNINPYTGKKGYKKPDNKYNSINAKRAKILSSYPSYFNSKKKKKYRKKEKSNSYW